MYIIFYYVILYLPNLNIQRECLGKIYKKVRAIQFLKSLYSAFTEIARFSFTSFLS